MNKKIDNIGLFLQCVLTSAVVISLITSIFIGPLLLVTYALTSLILFTLAYNNYTIYKRKYMTVIYFIFGFLVLISTFIGVINGI